MTESSKPSAPRSAGKCGQRCGLRRPIAEPPWAGLAAGKPTPPPRRSGTRSRAAAAQVFKARRSATEEAKWTPPDQTVHNRSGACSFVDAQDAGLEPTYGILRNSKAQVLHHLLHPRREGTQTRNIGFLGTVSGGEHRHIKWPALMSAAPKPRDKSSTF